MYYSTFKTKPDLTKSVLDTVRKEKTHDLRLSISVFDIWKAEFSQYYYTTKLVHRANNSNSPLPVQYFLSIEPGTVRIYSQMIPRSNF